MKRARSVLAFMLALLLALTAAPVYANEALLQGEGELQQEAAQELAVAPGLESGYVRIQNKWKRNYLYEDESGVVRYGFPAYDDKSAQWLIEDYQGNKRIRNRATGHYITIADVQKRRDPLTSREITTSTLADQWTIHESNRAGFVVIKSATVPENANLVIHQEDQLGFAEVSNDINITFESPQWAFEPVEAAAPVRLANKFRAGQYLYEGEGGAVDYGETPALNRNSHWILEPGTTPGTYRLKNRATGNYVTQVEFWEPITAKPLDHTSKSEWTINPTESGDFITIQNVDVYQSESKVYVLNTQYDDIHARSNDWSVPERDNAQWRVEVAPDVQPYRIANFTPEKVSNAYLHEAGGVVNYGSLTTDPGQKAFYQWVTENFNGKQRLRNLATGHYITREGAGPVTDPLRVAQLEVSTAADQWTIINSKLYDDYKTIQSQAGQGEYLHIQNSTGAAQAGAIPPGEDAAQWLFEDPVLSGDGSPQYFRIQNEWKAFVLYEDEAGQLKYGNVAEDDHKGQWLIERFKGRKRIQNRATGHYINLERVSEGKISVSDVDDEWKSAIWVIEDIDGAKLIHSVLDANEVPEQQKYVNLENLTKYPEYGVINPKWGSTHWRFVLVTDTVLSNVRLKNKANGNYLYEVTETGDELGKLKYEALPETDQRSVWYLERTGDGPTSVRLKNLVTGHYVAMEHVGLDVEQDAPPQQIIAQGDICPCWGSAKWLMEPGVEEGLTILKSGWASHLLYADEEGFTKVSKLVAESDSAQFIVEPVVLPSEPLPNAPIRIKNKATGEFLYENNGGIVLYGSVAENNGYSHWLIEDRDGVQRLKNRASGRYITMNHDYDYLEVKDADIANAASQWAVERTPGGAEYFIRSLNGKYNDELIHVENRVGYPERGLYPVSLGTVQWVFELAPEQFEKPAMGEEKTYDTATPSFNANNYVRIKGKKSTDYLYESDGKVQLGKVSENRESSQWLLQDYNGRRLLRNKASGNLIAWSEEGLVTVSGDARGEDAAQWTIEDRAGYQQLFHAAGQNGTLLLDRGQVKYGVPDQIEQSLWQLVPVASNQRYEAEKAFYSGTVALDTLHDDYSGEGYVGSFTATGDKITFTVHAQSARSYNTELRYWSEADAGKTLSLYVNGLKVKQQSFDPAEGEPGWADAGIAIRLRKGINTITLQKDAADTGDIWLDGLLVKNSVGLDYRGATVPYITYEAEHGKTNGELIGPSRKYREIASEASGRQAVKLAQVGQYVEFELAKPANSLVLRYVIPDSEDGSGRNETLALYVNGVFKRNLSLSSKHAWAYGSYPWSKDPKQGNAHRFFAETHALIGDIKAGSKIRLQKNSDNKADYYVIDLADLEQVDGPLAKPEGFLSVTDFGAVANDGQDDTEAFDRAVAAAKEQGKGVWFPRGEFVLNQDNIILDNITIRGAGMWYTKLIGAKFIGKGANIGVYDLLIDGDLNVRDDEALTHAFYGGFGPGSVIQNVWVEHSKTGLWLSRVRGGEEMTDGLHMVGLRLRNLMADGINFSVGTKNSLMEQSVVRYPGDDGIAIWSAEGVASVNNTARFNTVALPWLADNFVIFGGIGNKLQDNIGTDTITNGAGIAVSTRFNPVEFGGTTIVERNTLQRTGSADMAYSINLGAIWIFAGEKSINSPVILRDNVALDSTYAGLTIHGLGFNLNHVSLQNIVLDGMGTNGIDVTSNVAGNLLADNIIVRGEKIATINNNNDRLTFTERNEGFANRPKPFLVELEDGSRGPFLLAPDEQQALRVLGPSGEDVTDDASFTVDEEDIVALDEDNQLIALNVGATELIVQYGDDSRVFTVEVKEPVTFISDPEEEEEEENEGGGAVYYPSGNVSDTSSESSQNSKLKEQAAGNTKRIVFGPNELGADGQLTFSAEELLAAAKASPESILVIEQGTATYEFPLALVPELLKQTKLTTDSKLVWSFTVKTADQQTRDTIRTKAEASGIRLAGLPVEFGITVSDGSQTVAITSFGHHYVKRIITADGELDVHTAAAFIFDPVKGSFRYAPALFQAKDGKTVAAILSTGNSIYVLASNPKSFPDIESHWAKANIERLTSRQIVSGVSESIFAPAQTVTRAEFAAMLTRALGLQNDSQKIASDFKDVPAPAWYADSVAAAAKAGLLKGYADGTFRPNATITREQMAVMAANAITFARNAGADVPQAISKAPIFKDESDVHTWAVESVRQAAAAGILEGNSKGQFLPLDRASRAEAATIIVRLLQYAQLLNK
ncbi:S-layer homology domain-containing protein [Paenibacillus sp. GCM10012307]|uniref:S-layer homology domain-containing protein n=1 Tax=Paenibacillus roseus TaxID=2798579 RepID=A0A934J4H0_9BACL|nr:S-layer homology domain-containing protein [Paenibacillus roseus]MBJ6361368.1 S-layer homology domain-containing protein [Paenibacillus roseus]